MNQNSMKKSERMQASKDDETLDREEWHPTPDQMADYLFHELAMAKSNLLLVLAYGPHSFREIRESTLHSSDTMDAALTHHLKAGTVKELDDGKFAMA